MTKNATSNVTTITVVSRTRRRRRQRLPSGSKKTGLGAGIFFCSEFIVAAGQRQGNRAAYSFSSFHCLRTRLRGETLAGLSQSAAFMGAIVASVRQTHQKPPALAAQLLFWRLLLENRKWFLVYTLAALALRLAFYFLFPHVTGDSLIYGDIAKNWLDHGIFGLSHAEGVRPTWIRLPGYPAFLVLCFELFGREHYHAVLLAQIAIDVTCCLVIADLARRTVSARAALWAFALAALCPFTANYTVAPLAETLSIFFAAVALDAAVAGFEQARDSRFSWGGWTICALAL